MYLVNSIARGCTERKHILTLFLILILIEFTFRHVNRHLEFLGSPVNGNFDISKTI